ncbi:MAG TPA: nucleoside hydrolase [Bauldia sp.]|nr:nucleoside hydrolase [Bauldia sp.]
MPAKRRIIIDTDPGQDDAVAILTALASPDDFEILGIVAVAGNAPLAHTERNARRIVELAGRQEVPVYAGCARPMVTRARIGGEHVHGRTGLDGADLPEPKVALQGEHGVDFIIAALRAAEPGSVTLCALGPLTNIAMALVKAPDIAAHVREVVMMGGAYFEVGNITPAAEFNIYVDPEAADVVMQSGIPIVMSPLDLTHRMLTTRERLDGFRKLGNRAGAAVAGWLGFSERFDLAKYGSDGAPLHDPTVMAYLLKPELFTGKTVNVTIEINSPLTLGMTVTDWWQITERPRNVLYLRDGDAEGFYGLLRERLARLP